MLLNGTEMQIWGNSAIGVESAANVGKRRTLSSGAVTETYLSMKEYGQKFNLKGQALKRAHERYRLDRGTAANANLASAIAKGQVVLERTTVAKDRASFTAKFTAASVFSVSDPKAEANKLSDAELMEILEARKKSAGEGQGTESSQGQGQQASN